MSEFNLTKFLKNNPLYNNSTNEINIISKKDLKKIIKESIIEAKKVKDDEEIDFNLEDDSDLNLNGLDNMEDDSEQNNKMDSELQEINDLLLDLQQKALNLAKDNSDSKDPKFSKFQTQVSNTIKFFTSDFIADKNI